MLLLEINQDKISDKFTFQMLMLEGRLDFIYDTFKDKLEKRYTEDQNIPSTISSKIGEDAPKNLIDHFSALDPTPKKVYTQWIVVRYLKGEKLEDLDKLDELLPMFNKVKKDLELSNSNKDPKNIASYGSVSDLYKVLGPFIADASKGRSSKEVSVEDKGNVDWVMKTDNYWVITPKSHGAACEWSRFDTIWCTSRIKSPEVFDDHNEQGPLYIIITNKTGVTGKTGEDVKFQIHYHTNQFTNKDDEPITAKEIAYLSSFPEHKKFLNKLIDKHYSASIKSGLANVSKAKKDAAKVESDKKKAKK